MRGEEGGERGRRGWRWGGGREGEDRGERRKRFYFCFLKLWNKL